MTALVDIQVLEDWLAEPQTKAGLQRCANNAIAAIDANLSLRVPKTEQERRNAFAGWLEGYRVKIGVEIEKQFVLEFPGIFQHLSENAVRETISHCVWPLLEAGVQHRFQHKFIPYAVLSQAIAWGRRNIGDASLYGQPQNDGCLWRVALGVAGYAENLGQITLDMDGNIVPDQTTTREELLKHIHDYPSVPAEAVHA